MLATLSDDGEYEVTLAARDAVGGTASSGNRSGDVVVSFTIDNTAPAVPTLLLPMADAFVNGNPTQTWEAVADADHYVYASYYDENGNNQAYTTTVHGTSRSVGGMQTVTFWWRVKAVDAAGNESGWSELRKLNVDNTKPVIVMSGDAEMTVAQGSTYVDEGATCTDVLDGACTVTATSDVDTSIVGTYTVAYDATDTARNVADTVTRTVHVTDQTAPVVTIEAPSADATLRGTVDIYATIKENVAMGNYNIAIYPGDADFMDFSTRLEQENVNPAAIFSNEKIYGWDTTAYDDGVYLIRFAARDAAGNRDLNVGEEYTGGNDSQHVIRVTVDNTAPMATIDGESPKATYNGNTDISVHAIDDNYSRTELYRSGEVSPFKTYTGAWFGLWWLADNDYRMVVIDEAGNSTEYTFMVDRTDPIITFKEPTTGSVHTGDIHLRATCDEECDYVNFWWRAEGESFDSASKRYHYVHDNGTNFEWDLNSLAAEKADGSTYAMSDGTYYLYAAGKDVVGNWARTAGEVEISIDNTAPESTIDGGEDGARVYMNEWDGSISGTASDNLSGVNRVELSIMRESDGTYYDGGSWVAGEAFVTATGAESWTYALPSPAEDVYTVVSHAVDEAGNREDTYTITIVYDVTIPEVDLMIDPAERDGDNGWYITTPNITLVASDNYDLEKIEYRFEDNADWTLYAGPVTVTDGKRTFSYRATDMAGNVTDTGVKYVKVDTEAPDEVNDTDAEYEDGELTLYWDVDDDDIDRVYVYRGSKKTFSRDRHSLIGNNDDNEEEFTDDDVEPGRRYYYKLVSRDEAGNMGGAKIISVRIPEEEGESLIVTDEGTEADVPAVSEENSNGEGEAGASGGEVAGEEIGEEEGVVEGVSTSATGRYGWLLWILLAIVVGYAAYWRFVGRKAEESAK